MNIRLVLLLAYALTLQLVVGHHGARFSESGAFAWCGQSPAPAPANGEPAKHAGDDLACIASCGSNASFGVIAPLSIGQLTTVVQRAPSLSDLLPPPRRNAAQPRGPPVDLTYV